MMFAVAWRHNANSPWTLLKDIETSEQDARAKINMFGKYDAVSREYRILPLGDADTWHDPVAEDKVEPAVSPLRQWVCHRCKQPWPDSSETTCGKCGGTTMTNEAKP